MLRHILAIGAVLSGLPSLAQDVDYGLTVPVTVSGGALYTQRLQLADPSASPAAAAFRAMLYPTLKLGSNWFGYAAIQVRSTPYFYYDAFSPDHDVYTDVLQAFVGYSFRRDKISMVIKAGKLTSAFGAFPLHYDDAENPLLDQPLSYITDLPISPAWPPSGTDDLVHQHYGSGPVPVTLYGLPGVQAEVSSGPVDARLQITGGSPASPKTSVLQDSICSGPRAAATPFTRDSAWASRDFADRTSIVSSRRCFRPELPFEISPQAASVLTRNGPEDDGARAPSCRSSNSICLVLWSRPQ